MQLNHVDRPSTLALTEVMRKVNAYGHAPRVIVELDKFSYVRGLKKKYETIEFITKETVKNIVSIINTTETDGGFHANPPVMPIEGKNKLSDMVITSRHRNVNTERKSHKGLDLDLAIGDPVVSVWGGTVIEVKYDDGGYGHYVTVDHGNGVKTRYAHLSSTLVNVGQVVTAGQRVGLGGNSGRSIPSGGGDGSHLHFEVWKDGLDLNPEPILGGTVAMNGISATGSENTGSVTTVTKTTENVTYEKDLTASSPDTKFKISLDGEYFTANTPDGAKKMLGWSKADLTTLAYIEFKHTWFNDGYLSFSYFYDKVTEFDKVIVQMDGANVWSFSGIVVSSGIAHPAPITVPKGEHTFRFLIKNPDLKSDSKFGIMNIKAAEFTEVEEQVVVPSTSGYLPTGGGYRSTVWDYEDSMDNLSKWTHDNDVTNGGDYIKVGGNSSISRFGDVKFPFSTQFTIKIDPESTQSNFKVSNGSKAFTVKFKPGATESGSASYSVDNTDWQKYMLVAKDANNATLFIERGGAWTDTGLTVSSTASDNNVVQFYVASGETGSLYVDDVKYVSKDFSTTAPTTVREMKTEDRWYDLGGFVFDETFYLEDDIMNWEVSEHLDMSSSTARVTLSNHHGLYSSEYVRDSIFPDNLRPNPYSYYEEGHIRHVISEYTPVRIYVGYGEQVVRKFTGMIKGEVEEDSEARTITFNCVDRYDLLEECILLKDMQFPPEEAFQGDATPRPWIKSSIVQALANHAGMTGWRYVWEDLMHPDLVIEETYYTDVNQSNSTFMKYDSKGVLEQVSLDVKTPNGYKNPFVEGIIFNMGERVSDCIRRIVDEINFRAYVNRYGTFVMHRIDFENNMRWDFKSGENLHSLNTSTDYSRVRNHIIVTGSKGNRDNYFDKDLIVATKGHIRTTQVDCPWVDEANGVSSPGAKKEIADKLFFDMKRQARTKNVVVKGNPFIEILDGCYVYDSNTSTAGYYIIKGNTLTGDSNGMINKLELTWEEKV